MKSCGLNSSEDVVAIVGGDVVFFVGGGESGDDGVNDAEEIRHGVPHRGALLV